MKNMQDKEFKIEFNECFKKSLNLMERTHKNVFITGKAGTGKSTLLNYFSETSGKNIAVIAPTGVAAINVGGQTIHSFFGFSPGVTVDKVKKLKEADTMLYKSIETIIIDEISMVRADLLDCVDRFLRINGKHKSRPFGGTQMIFIGDLYQLPPVVRGKEKGIFKDHYKSEYFFDSVSFSGLEIEYIELEKIYRQKDEKFIGLLNSIRNNSINDEGIIELNKRLNENFEPDQEDFFITLTTTNKMSLSINEKELEKLETELYEFEGKIKGDFKSEYLPTEIELKMKPGSQIMMVNNDSGGRWVNGSVGRILSIEKDEENKTIIKVRINDGSIVTVGKHTWKISRLGYNPEKKSIFSESIGSFTQYPLRLAWAVTIHKSQGKTFNNVIIDIGKGTFSHGQMYVALSRCTHLDGIILRKPIQKKHIWMDFRVVNFITGYQYMISDKKCSKEDKIEMIKKAIKEKSMLEIVYLKRKDEKSKRKIRPYNVGEMEYMGKSYTGVEAYCMKRRDDRVFRVDRILEIREIN